MPFSNSGSRSVGELSPAYVPALFLGSFSAGERTKVVLLLSLHPHLFPVLVGVGVIQLVLLARPTAAVVATVSKSGEGESSRRKGELDVVMWDTGYPAAAAAADMSEVEMGYVQVHFKEEMVGQRMDSYSVPTSDMLRPSDLSRKSFKRPVMYVGGSELQFMPQAQTALLRPPAGYGPLLSILRRREIACQGPLHKIGQRSPFLLLPMDIAPPSLARGYSASFQVSLREFFIPRGERCSLHSLASRWHVRKQSNFRGHFFLPPPGPFLSFLHRTCLAAADRETN